MRILLVASVIAAAVIGAHAQNPTSSTDLTGGFGPDSPYSTAFNPADTFTFDGVVTTKIIKPPLAKMTNSVRVILKQTGGQIYNVELGPEWFVSKMPFQVNVGDSLIIQGSRSVLNGKPTIFAEFVTKGDQTVLLRKRNGWARWNAAEHLAAAPESPAYSGTVSGISVANFGGVSHDVVQLETGLGSISIIGAPSWYRERQLPMINIGNNVSVFGSMRMVPLGNNVFVADGFFSGGTYFMANPW